METVKSSISWLVSRGLDNVFPDNTEPDDGEVIYEHRPGGTAVLQTKPVALSEGTTALIKFWTPNGTMLTLLPRAAQALSAAVATLSESVGYAAAAAALLPASVMEDNATWPGHPYRTATYQASNGGTVQISFDGGNGNPVESVTAFRYSQTYAYKVDATRPFYLLESTSA